MSVGRFTRPFDRRTIRPKKGSYGGRAKFQPLGHVAEETCTHGVSGGDRHGSARAGHAARVVAGRTPSARDEVLVLRDGAGRHLQRRGAGPLACRSRPFDVHKAAVHMRGSDAAGHRLAVGRQR